MPDGHAAPTLIPVGAVRPRRILAVFGTRPEAIKMMPVVAELRRRGFDTLACSTGQHREMLDQALQAFDAQPDIDLGLMRPGQSLALLTARALTAVSEVLERQRPDLVLVHGDTTTTMAAALAAFYAGIAIGHVEAGLRSFDLGQPWPEEFNRVAVDQLAALMFAPTEAAAANLRRAGHADRRIVVTGNTGIDALLGAVARLEGDAALASRIAGTLPRAAPGRRLVLVTAHRRENLGPGLARICSAVRRIAARGDVEVVYPLHLNPEVREVARAELGGRPAIHLVPPLGYLEMVALLRRAALVLTDSGGLQEEGPALGRPVLVMRDATERPEALATGLVRLVGTDPGRLCAEAARVLEAGSLPPAFPYGDGTAARRIVDAIEGWQGA
jgi:UDP-N-acetylglucosamine 2-epimerase